MPPPVPALTSPIEGEQPDVGFGGFAEVEIEDAVVPRKTKKAYLSRGGRKHHALLFRLNIQ